MALFIAQENQQLLYEMIHKTPSLALIFPPGSRNDEKNAWFRGIIEHFYRQINGSLNRDQLKTLNRNVLGYMVAQLQQRIQSAESSLSVVEAPSPQISIDRYKTMFDAPKPNTIDFSEKIDDEAITNMAELIENHKKMREQELQLYSPPAPASLPTSPITVKIMQDVPKEELEIIQEKPDKKVKFQLPIPDVSTEIENIKNKIVSIDEKLDEIFVFMKQLANTPVDIIKSQMNILSDESKTV